ncbi:MAG: GIY-YIG nuclease family protein [Candidatus Zhuqueibacterota bacterium]
MIDRKQARQHYKQTPRPAGVILIKNLVNGKMFIDSSPNLNVAFNKHKAQLKFGSHRNQRLQQDWNQFGPDNFSFEILEQLKLQEDVNYNYTDDLKILRQIWLDKLQPFDDRGYNKKT